MSDNDRIDNNENSFEIIDFSTFNKKKKKTGSINNKEINEDAKSNDIKDNICDEVIVTKDVPQSQENLISIVQGIMREKNPEFAEKKKFIMKPPSVHRVGSKKCAWVNFSEICNFMHRQPDHVLNYYLSELGTSGNLTGQNQLLLKGIYNNKQIEGLLKKQIFEYVTCNMCKSPDTTMERDNTTRLFVLKCAKCKSHRTVQQIRSGQHAQTRAERMKAKQKV